MQFIFNEDSNLYGYADTGGGEFEFPSNIKQMGCLEDGIKIYMEDYVYTYLYQYAKAGNGKERLAALVGRHLMVDGKEVIVVSGAIQGRYSAVEHGVESFTEATWKYINNQMDIYFKDLSVVGWVHTQPGFGSFLMARDETFHKEFFSESWQILFVIDPLDKLDTFFVHNEQKTGLRPARGYFIYYEKNEKMQEYMLDNNLKYKVIVDETADTLQDTEQEERVQEERVQEERVQAVALEKPAQLCKPTPEQRLDAAKDIRRILQKRAKETEEEGKSKFTLLAGVSTLLCLVCLLMGVSLMNNIDRLQRLETELAGVQNSYMALAQMMESNKTQMVFAGQEGVEKAEKTEENTATQTAEAQTEQKVEEVVPQQPEVAQATPEQTPAPEVPVEATTQTEAVEAKPAIREYYIVEDGDNLGYISMKFFGSQSRIGDIMELNNIEDANMIRIGQKLSIPQ